jgi:hypothetical protein
MKSDFSWAGISTGQLSAISAQALEGVSGESLKAR